MSTLRQVRLLSRPNPADWRRFLIVMSMISSALVAGILYAAGRSGITERYGIYVLCLVPVALAALGWERRLPMLAFVAFFESLLLAEICRDWFSGGFTAASMELFLTGVAILLVVPLMAGVFGSLRERRQLGVAVHDLEALLVRSADSTQVVEFLLGQMQDVAPRAGAAVLLRRSSDGAHELITRGERLFLGQPGIPDGKPLSLAAWLVLRDRPQLFNDLAGDPRFVSTRGSGSLLAYPMRDSGGMLLAMLVLVDQHAGAFKGIDLQALAELAVEGEKALVQADLYAQADRVLIRRATQLGAIQRAASESNAALDVKRIVDLTLDCALEVTGADAGLVSANIPGFSPDIRVAGAPWDADRVAAAVARSERLERPSLDLPVNLAVQVLLPDAGSRLIAPIHRAGRFLGSLIVEGRRAGEFDQEDLQIVRSLTDQAGVALDNARLFDEIRGERARSEQIIRNMADGLVAADADGCVTVFNPAAEALTGWGHDEALGRRICDVLGCGDDLAGRGGCCILDTINRGGAIVGEKRTLRRRDGTPRIISLSATPLFAGEAQVPGLVLLVRDLTPEEEMERFQQELVAAFSHDLRTPLTNISALAEILAEEDASQGGSKADYLQALRAQSRRLADLMDRTLDVSRLDAGQWPVEMRPIPALRLVTDVVYEWRKTVADHELYLDLAPGPAWIWADERALGTVLSNLIDNAVKYSPAGAQVRISIARTASDEMTIAVHNEESFIAPEHQLRIFQRFFRVDRSDAQEVYGSGLGLYIASRLVEQMGGRISVTSEPGAGTRFAFTMRLVKEDQLETAAH